MEPELRSGVYGFGAGRERGKRPRIGIGRSERSRTTHKQVPKRGWTAVGTADADMKQERHTSPTPNGKEGKGGGTGPAVEEDR